MNRRKFIEKSTLSSLGVLYAPYLSSTYNQEEKTISNNKQAAKLLARPYRGDYKRPKI